MEKTRGAGSCQQDERRRDASAALEGMYAARRAALKRLIDQQFNGNERAFALKIEYPASQINDMRKGRKGFGEKIAYQFEDSLDLPRGTLAFPGWIARGEAAATPEATAVAEPSRAPYAPEPRAEVSANAIEIAKFFDLLEGPLRTEFALSIVKAVLDLRLRHPDTPIDSEGKILSLVR